MVQDNLEPQGVPDVGIEIQLPNTYNMEGLYANETSLATNVPEPSCPLGKYQQMSIEMDGTQMANQGDPFKTSDYFIKYSHNYVFSIQYISFHSQEA